MMCSVKFVIFFWIEKHDSIFRNIHFTRMEIVCLCFWVIHSYDDVTIVGNGLQNFGLCLAFE